MQIRLSRNHARRGNAIVALFIVVIGVFIVFKLWSCCKRLFPPPPSPPAQSTNVSPTNLPPGAWAQYQYFTVPDNSPLAVEHSRFVSVLWGVIPTHIPDNHFPYADAVPFNRIQVVEPEARPQDFQMDTIVAYLHDYYHLDMYTDPATVDHLLSSGMGGYSYQTWNPATSAWEWQTGTVYTPYSGASFNVPILNGPDTLHPVQLQSTTNGGATWEVVDTGWMGKGMFNVYVDWMRPGSRFFRSVMVPPGSPAVVTGGVK